VKSIGLGLLALWLISQSIISLTGFNFPYQKLLLPILALSAGIVLILYVIQRKFSDIGLFLLAIWLILRSGLYLFHFSFPYSDMTVAILGLVTAVFLIIRK